MNIISQSKSITGSISFINTLFEGLKSIITIIIVIKNIVVGVSTALSAPTSDGSVPAEVGVDAGQVTVQSILDEALKKVLCGIIVEAVSTSVIGLFSQQDYSNEHIGVSTSKLGARVVINANRLYKGINGINSVNTKLGSIGCGFALGFGVLRDLVGVACTVSTMLTELTFDSYSYPIQQELEYRMMVLLLLLVNTLTIFLLMIFMLIN